MFASVSAQCPAHISSTAACPHRVIHSRCVDCLCTTNFVLSLFHQSSRFPTHSLSLSFCPAICSSSLAFTQAMPAKRSSTATSSGSEAINPPSLISWVRISALVSLAFSSFYFIISTIRVTIMWIWLRHGVSCWLDGRAQKWRLPDENGLILYLGWFPFIDLSIDRS